LREFSAALLNVSEKKTPILMIDKISQSKLVPVVVIDNVKDALPLAEALLKAGLNVIEVTLRTEAALESMKVIAKEFPDMILGAGTILNPGIIPELIDSGVSFGISPGINPKVIEAADKNNFPMIPGVISPCDIELARSLGLNLLKFFPAEAAGGAAMVKALAAPYGHTGIKFIPTGGINSANMMDYLVIPEVIAIGGSWFVSKALVNNGKFEEITKLTQEALKLTSSLYRA
jgi:2-dehydro-3-deoxyphosphogluconate aldolase/(4S)-4-hydroxy-2-oxoglutarate aldolase